MAKTTAAEETEKFREVFLSVVNYATGPELMNNDVADARKWYKKAFEYAGSPKHIYGQMVVTFYRYISQDCTEDELYLARVLGSCLEIWKNASLMGDDVLDGQTIRYGKLCWYRCEGVGKMALVDSGFFYCVVYKVLKKHFGKKPYYSRLFDYLRDATFWEFVGVCEDLKTDWKEKTTEQCETLNKVKSKVCMAVPITLTMILAGITNDKDYEDVQQIFEYIGHWQQDQNDYKDFYGEVMGEDIQEGHCTWMFGQALARSSKTQLKILKDNYGQKDPKCVDAIKHLYEELNLKDVFAAHQKKWYRKVLRLIEAYDGVLPKQMLMQNLEDMYDLKYM